MELFTWEWRSAAWSGPMAAPSETHGTGRPGTRREERGVRPFFGSQDERVGLKAES